VNYLKLKLNNIEIIIAVLLVQNVQNVQNVQRFSGTSILGVMRLWVWQ
jgi:hypothetical protein